MLIRSKVLCSGRKVAPLAPQLVPMVKTPTASALWGAKTTTPLGAVVQPTNLAARPPTSVCAMEKL